MHAFSKAAEEAIRAATRDQDFSPFHELVEVLKEPFVYRPARRDFATPPRPEEEVRQTFCGT